MDVSSLEQLLRERKNSAAVAEVAALRLDEEAAGLRQRRAGLRDEAAEWRKSHDAAVLLLRQLQETAQTVTAVVRESEKRNAGLRQELDDGVNEKQRLRLDGQQQSDDLSRSLQQDAAAIRGLGLRRLQLDDDEEEESGGGDASDGL